MSKTAWPNEAEVQATIIASGLMDSCTSSVQDFIDGAVAEFERRTGYEPFLAESVDSVAYFDGPYPSTTLFFTGGYASITSIARGTTALVASTDYELWPANAALKGQPYTALDLRSAIRGVRAITVTGKRGYGTSIPVDAWLAVQRKAAKDAAAFLSTTAGNIAEVQQGPVRIKYAGVDAQGAGDDDLFEAAVRRYRKR